jgi:hypothetical protein
MNDLEILRGAWEEPAPPASAARARARAALLDRGRAQPRRRRRMPRRAALAAGLAAAAIAALGIAHDLAGTPGPVEAASAAEVLQRAADAAQRRPFTAPLDHQWIYTEEKITDLDDGRTLVMETWRRADGEFEMRRGGGRPAETGRLRPTGPLDSYKAAAALPTDPAALLAWARSQTGSITGAGSTPEAEMYGLLRGILDGNGVLPPDVAAAVFGALKRIPGVTVRTVDVNGRRVIALALTDEWLRQELLLDAETYAYTGQQSTVVEDAVVSPEKAGNATGRIEKGSSVVSVRIAAGVVEKPGERP